MRWVSKEEDAHPDADGKPRAQYKEGFSIRGGQCVKE